MFPCSPFSTSRILKTIGCLRFNLPVSALRFHVNWSLFSTGDDAKDLNLHTGGVHLSLEIGSTRGGMVNVSDKPDMSRYWPLTVLLAVIFHFVPIRGIQFSFFFLFLNYQLLFPLVYKILPPTLIYHSVFCHNKPCV